MFLIADSARVTFLPSGQMGCAPITPLCVAGALASGWTLSGGPWWALARAGVPALRGGHGATDSISDAVPDTGSLSRASQAIRGGTGQVTLVADGASAHGRSQSGGCAIRAGIPPFGPARPAIPRSRDPGASPAAPHGTTRNLIRPRLPDDDRLRGSRMRARSNEPNIAATMAAGCGHQIRRAGLVRDTEGTGAGRLRETPAHIRARVDLYPDRSPPASRVRGRQVHGPGHLERSLRAALL
jgi:hypothetical protein